MNVTDFQEVWQIDINGQVYEANFEVMAHWVFEGSLLPQDMVKRGNLRWIEARKVPALMQFFNAKEQGMAPPVFASTTDGQAAAENSLPPQENFSPLSSVTSNYQTNVNQPPVETSVQPPQNSFNSPQSTQNFQPLNSFQPQNNFESQNPFQAQNNSEQQNDFQPLNNFQPQNNWQESNYSQTSQNYSQSPQNFNQTSSAEFCSMHPDEKAFFVCETCANGFCKVCPKSYGGTVKICPFCGALCKNANEAKKQTHENYQYQNDISKGFGFEDFFTALAYPFKFKVSLFVGALMFAFFSIGQGAASMGMSFFLMGAAIMCFMFANMLTFGILANTVDNFSQGKIGGNFMPSFDDFSLWEDVLQPFFLSMATYLVSFGLLIAIVGYMIYSVFAVMQTKAPTMDEKILVAQRELEKKNGDTRFEGLDTKDEKQKLEELQKSVQDARKKDFESVIGKTPETEQQDAKTLVETIVGKGGWMIWASLLALLWGLFYYPAACCVAGYTRSFVATLNPSIGLDTIKVLGVDYVKILLMTFVLSAFVFAVNVVLAKIFKSVDLPTVGNLPAKFFGSIFGFYIAVVFAVTLGFALYKNSDRLKLYK